ncbi:MAG: hypothetical protein QXM02_07670 [Thermoproteota archaeon]
MDGFKTVSNSLKLGRVSIPIILLFMIPFTLHAHAYNGNPKLIRMLELNILSNSTIIARVSSTSLTWGFFKENFYRVNESYWHYNTLDKIVKMFGLSDYHILRMGEEESQRAFIVELAFQLNNCKNYENGSGRLKIIDPFKENEEYFSSVKIESQINIYDCSPRDKVLPLSWFSTRKLEWYNHAFYEAPDEYYIFFKIPIYVITTLPPDSVWRLYVNSEYMEVVGNSSMIYVDEGDIVSVERILEYKNDTRYVCYSPLSYILYATVMFNRTLIFRYNVEYLVSFDSKVSVEAIIVNGFKYSAPFKTWVCENTIVNASIVPASVQGSFVNHVFDGWIDDEGRRFNESFIVTEPMRLSTLWRKELNIDNIAIIIIILTIGFLIPEIRKRVAVEVIRRSEYAKETNTFLRSIKGNV